MDACAIGEGEMDRLKRKMKLGFLAGLCLLISIFGLSFGGGLAGSVPTTSVVENADDGDGDELVTAKATYTDTTYSGSVTLSSDTTYDGCYFKTGYAATVNANVIVNFNDCYFDGTPTITTNSGTVLNFNRCIFLVTSGSRITGSTAASIYMTDCLDAGSSASMLAYGATPGTRYYKNVYSGLGSSTGTVSGSANVTANATYKLGTSGNPFYDARNFVTYATGYAQSKWSGEWNFSDKWMYYLSVDPADSPIINT